MQTITNMHDWMSHLPGELEQLVRERCTTRNLVEGASLWHPGDQSDACYRVLSGRLKVCNVNSVGQELVHTYILEGDCVGEWGLLIDEPRLNFTYATEPTRVMMLSRSDFKQLYNQYPEIPRALCVTFAQRMRHFVMLAEDASLLPLRQRLARAILRIGHTHGSVDPDGRTVIQNVSHDELSKIVGASRQSVGRELRKLKESGDIVIGYNSLVINDIAALDNEYNRLVSVEPVAPSYEHVERDD